MGRGEDIPRVGDCGITYPNSALAGPCIVDPLFYWHVAVDSIPAPRTNSLRFLSPLKKAKKRKKKKKTTKARVDWAGCFFVSRPHVALSSAFGWAILVTVIFYSVSHKLNEWMFIFMYFASCFFHGVQLGN
ncbi:hypothetical protein F4813DRAFT_32174 [Daldinia decipiens]|uniref:uncharacterized protein n=1 Tax=Daldinia decipiens TaxID=326647 RepID=UPI0020C255B6|nr:uncharacterized protein F4813DRAFT_32174 [Daldinia decipiens]KAI1658877.1 hypothetical protein F4813DRAFT_32174 [Daldinia decipiens]